MIKLIKKGKYELLETPNDTKILILDSKVYNWPYVKGIGELLTLSDYKRNGEHVLATGIYNLYDIKDELKFVDLQHLELSVGKGKWQGYLLLTGLPTSHHTRRKIVPTNEIISNLIKEKI